ncbi:hypothetical protein D3C86_1802310 [compost metagenome]
MPPPMQAPWMAASVGTGLDLSSRMARCACWPKAMPFSLDERNCSNSSISAPLPNASVPAPRSTMQRSSGSAFKACSFSPSSSHMAWLMALRLAVLSMVR